MAEEIVNKVAKSPLVTLDLGDYYPQGERKVLDIAPWLLEGIMLREKDFRESVQQHPWSKYLNTYVAVHCSTDAIVPQWAYMLLAAHLAPYAHKVVYGDAAILESFIMEKAIDAIDVEEYKNKPVIVKGCGDRPIPNHAYLHLAAVLQPVVKTLMFGEACSTVPVYKKKKANG